MAVVHLGASRTGHVDTSFAKGQTLASWMTLLSILDVSTSPPEFTIANPRQDLDSVVSPSVRWIYDQASSVPLHYTFDTPVGQVSQCGRVVFSDFHVANANSSGTTFPAECTAGAMTAQEKVLEFLLFDLGLQHDPRLLVHPAAMAPWKPVRSWPVCLS